MDFLDPAKKRAYTIRLFIGYILMAILLAFASLILLFQAYGYDFDPKTGGVIQNGLVFVSSRPSGAAIFINDKQHNDKTDTRLNLPEGDYKIEIKADGYRDWQRSFYLEGGSIERLVYPLLIPNSPKLEEIQLLSGAPKLMTSSPDRRWLLMARPDSLTAYERHDLNDPDKLPVAINFPANIFSEAKGQHDLKLVEWSNNNRHLVVEHTADGLKEFILLDHESPESSVNINRLFKASPDSVTLRDKKFDQFYLHFTGSGLLQVGTLQNGALSSFLEGVLAFKSHGDDKVLYVTSPEMPGGKQRAIIKEGNKTYFLKELADGQAMLEVAKFNDDWYWAVGSKSEGRVYVYKNPLNFFKRGQDQRPAPIAVLRGDAPQALSFSHNTRFLSLQSGQKFNVFDAEFQRQYRFEVSEPFSGFQPVWMDGHRLAAVSSGTVVIFDFDGVNLQKLAVADPKLPVYFNQDYKFMYSVGESSTVPGRLSLKRTYLLAENR